MPAKSRAQQQAMAIAEHNPSKLYDKNKGLLSMSKPQLHDFAATPSKSLPAHVSQMGHSKKFMNKRGDHTSKLDHMWQGKKGGSACL